MKQMIGSVLILCLVLGFGAQPLPAQSAEAQQVTKKFFELEQSIDELRQEMKNLRQEVHEIEIRASLPEIRKEINKLIEVPEMTHEIVLKNGTVVRGKIIHEDIDKLVIQTQIGQLTIYKKEIKITREAQKPKPKCVFAGAIREEIYEDKRVYKGKIKNEGLRRADFPRVIFELYDENTQLVNQDSSFIQGAFHIFSSGVQTDATIEPGETYSFQCPVMVPDTVQVSYYIKKVVWEEL